MIPAAIMTPMTIRSQADGLCLRASIEIRFVCQYLDAKNTVRGSRRASEMKYYRCYLLTDDNHIASATILKCADDEDAKRRCQHVVATNGRFPAAEIWEGTRRVYRHPEDPKNAARGQRRRKGDARDQDQAIADALTAQIAEDRRRRLENDAVKAAQLREQRLEREAQSKMKTLS
jgi:hypothetical protein